MPEQLPPQPPEYTPKIPVSAGGERGTPHPIAGNANIMETGRIHIDLIRNLVTPGETPDSSGENITNGIKIKATGHVSSAQSKIRDLCAGAGLDLGVSTSIVDRVAEILQNVLNKHGECVCYFKKSTIGDIKIEICFAKGSSLETVSEINSGTYQGRDGVDSDVENSIMRAREVMDEVKVLSMGPNQTQIFLIKNVPKAV